MDNYKPQFRRIHDFMAKHLNATTDEEFMTMVQELSQFKPGFESDMAVAVCSEIQRLRLMEGVQIGL